MEYVIEIEGLTKSYPNFQLSDVNIAIPAGCVAGFIGLNGSGKTTTVRSMLGLSKRDGGKIELLGREFDHFEREIKDRIGVVFDEGYLYESLSMKAMKEIVSKAYTRWDEGTYRRLMERFGLEEKQQIATLSKGMKMKFALALALSHRAELLIMDEPTSGLDPLIRSELLGILREFMEEGGKGVFYSSHITSDLDQLADILVLIDRGKIVFVEDKDHLIEAHRLVKGDAAYLNEENKADFIDLKIGSYGFSGLTDRWEKVKGEIPEAVVERIDVETLMLAYVRGGEEDV